MALQQDIVARWGDAVRRCTEDEELIRQRRTDTSADDVADLVHPLLAALEESIEQIAHAMDELRGRMPPQLQ